MADQNSEEDRLTCAKTRILVFPDFRPFEKHSEYENVMEECMHVIIEVHARARETKEPQMVKKVLKNPVDAHLAVVILHDLKIAAENKHSGTLYFDFRGCESDPSKADLFVFIFDPKNFKASSPHLF